MAPSPSRVQAVRAKAMAAALSSARWWISCRHAASSVGGALIDGAAIAALPRHLDISPVVTRITQYCSCYVLPPFLVSPSSLRKEKMRQSIHSDVCSRASRNLWQKEMRERPSQTHRKIHQPFIPIKGRNAANGRNLLFSAITLYCGAKGDFAIPALAFDCRANFCVVLTRGNGLLPYLCVYWSQPGQFMPGPLGEVECLIPLIPTLFGDC